MTEWKAKKKEDENARKQDEERQRQEAVRNGQDAGPPQGTPSQYGQPNVMPHQMGGPQLPPIGYQPAGQPQGQYAQPQQVDGAPQYGPSSQMYVKSDYKLPTYRLSYTDCFISGTVVKATLKAHTDKAVFPTSKRHQVSTTSSSSSRTSKWWT